MKLECFKLVPSGNLKLVEAVSKISGSKNKAKKLINEGLVTVNGIKELRYRRRVSPKDKIVVSFNPYLFERKPLRFLYLKEGVAVI
ncbi:MAG: S4 domain-containing protein, partial [Desulfurobacteriaceae bacterium]